MLGLIGDILLGIALSMVILIPAFIGLLTGHFISNHHNFGGKEMFVHTIIALSIFFMLVMSMFIDAAHPEMFAGLFMIFLLYGSFVYYIIRNDDIDSKEWR